MLILSESGDITSIEVTQWLSHFNIPYKIVFQNDIQNLNHLELTNENVNLKLLGKYINKYSVIWIRRGGFNFIDSSLKLKSFYDYLKKEQKSIQVSLESIVELNTKLIGSYVKEVDHYKIEHLLEAKKIGLKIPSTLVTTNKKDLLCFFKKNKSIVSKDIRYSIRFQMEDRKFMISEGTTLVTNEMIDKLDNNFCPTLVQKKIEKLFEIRVFYIDNLFYSMAIFSQKDKRTELDYRNYNRGHENRAVPYILPPEIKTKIKLLTKRLELNTGSIDLIYSKNEEFIFLEVNPQGQLDWVSKNCNYYIERSIAKHLSNF